MERNGAPITSQPSTSGTRVSSTAQNGTDAPLATIVGYPIVQTAQPRGAPLVSIPHVMDRWLHPPAGRPANPYNTGRAPQFGGPSSAFRPILPNVNGQQGVARPLPFIRGAGQVALPFNNLGASHQRSATPWVSGWGSTPQGAMAANQARYHPSCPYHRCICFTCTCPCHLRTPRF